MIIARLFPLRQLALFAALLLLLPAAAFAQAAPRQDYDPAPAMWRLADADTTIYLFGTFHVLPEGFRWRNPRFDAIVREVDGLVLESSEEDALASLDELGPKMLELADARGATSLRLSPQLRGRWRQMIETSGLPYDAVDRMPLPLAILGFGFEGNETGASSYEFGVETVLAREFAASGRPVESIESHGGVLLSLMRIDDRAILAELEGELSRWSGKQEAGVITGAVTGDMPGAVDWAMEHAWAQGDLDEDFDLGLGRGKVGEAFHRVLLAQRNRAWAQWLHERLDQPGKILVAVGAGHFEGRETLLDFLDQRGLRAQRIN